MSVLTIWLLRIISVTVVHIVFAQNIGVLAILAVPTWRRLAEAGLAPQELLC